MLVPVVDRDQVPLMPTTKHRAMRMIEKGQATPFWKKGVWCIRLNKEPSARNMQPVAVGIDPGSKREAMVVKTGKATVLNVQMDAVGYVKERVETRREMRRGRRYRNTPYRKNRENRARGGLPPSTKARWQWKLRVLGWLRKLYPVTDVVVEDVKAKTWNGAKKWNKSFSPLEVGKRWFYGEIDKWNVRLSTKQGWETAEIRNRLGLKKNSNKMAMSWDAHCVDAWCLAYGIVGGEPVPDDKTMIHLTQIPLRRRQLHMLQPAKGGIRRSHGGTRSLGFKRGSLVRHPKYGVCYVGGTIGGRISLHDSSSGKRLCQNAKPNDLRFLTYNERRARLLPALKDGVSAVQKSDE